MNLRVNQMNRDEIETVETGRTLVAQRPIGEKAVKIMRIRPV